MFPGIAASHCNGDSSSPWLPMAPLTMMMAHHIYPPASSCSPIISDMVLHIFNSINMLFLYSRGFKLINMRFQSLLHPPPPPPPFVSLSSPYLSPQVSCTTTTCLVHFPQRLDPPRHSSQCQSVSYTLIGCLLACSLLCVCMRVKNVCAGAHVSAALLTRRLSDYLENKNGPNFPYIPHYKLVH